MNDSTDRYPDLDRPDTDGTMNDSHDLYSPEPTSQAMDPLAEGSHEADSRDDRKRWLKILLPFAALIVGGLIAFLLVSNRPTVEKQETPVVAPLVRTVTAEPRDVVMEVRTRATVEPRTESTLVAEVAGRIVWVAPAFAEGGAFRKGETLVRIDARDYELGVEQARAQVAQAEVLLSREEAEAEVALREWRELGPALGAGSDEGSGASSGARAEPPALVARKPQLAEARARRAGARAQQDAAELALARTRITAPFQGRVRRKLADLGQFVSPGAPVAEVYASDYAEVSLPVSLDELAFLDLESVGEGAGAPRVRLAARYAGQERAWEGRLVRVGGAVDPQTRQMNLIARVDGNAPSSGGTLPLAMGLFVEASIEGRVVPGVVELPRSALRGESRVLVVDDDERLRFREVGVLRRQQDTVYVNEGLSSGERVCISPLETPVDGMRVRLGEAEPEVER